MSTAKLAIDKKNFDRIIQSMNNQDFKKILDAAGLTYGEFAYLVGMSETAAKYWGMGKSQIPGPAAALICLLQARPELWQWLKERGKWADRPAKKSSGGRKKVRG